MSGSLGRAAVGAFLALVACSGAPADATSPRSGPTISRLEGHAQERHLTCESRCAADLLAAHGIAATEAEVFARLPRSDNPDLGFVGDPDGPTGRLPPEGYGVHAAPLAAAIRSFGLAARTETGRDLAWLRSETDAGRPVIAWVTGSCAPSVATPMVDGAGRPFRAVRGEHVVLVLSVRGGVLVLDPATGRRRTFAREDFDAAWALFERAAVSASAPPESPVR